MLFREGWAGWQQSKQFLGGAVGAEQFLPRVQSPRHFRSWVEGGVTVLPHPGRAPGLCSPKASSLESCLSYCWVLVFG